MVSLYFQRTGPETRRVFTSPRSNEERRHRGFMTPQDWARCVDSLGAFHSEQSLPIGERLHFDL